MSCLYNCKNLSLNEKRYKGTIRKYRIVEPPNELSENNG